MTDQIKEVAMGLVAACDAELLAMSAEEIAGGWYWSWDESHGIEWNIYKFSDILELHKRRWRRWEEHHNGSVCVVERVRDKYVMPRVRQFLAELITHLSEMMGEE
jgi:hypothetical protein